MFSSEIDPDHDGVANTLSIDNVRHRLNVWNNHYISPGPVSSVGDVLLGVRLKHSMPSLPLRYDPVFSKGEEPRLGSNVTDGMVGNYITNAGPPTLLDTNWQGNRSFKVRHGWIYQDLRAVDRTIQPIVGETPDYSWLNRIATNYNARHTGDQFLPEPGGYAISPGEVPRGGRTPRITATVAGDVLIPPEASVPIGPQTDPRMKPITFGENEKRNIRKDTPTDKKPIRMR